MQSGPIPLKGVVVLGRPIGLGTTLKFVETSLAGAFLIDVARIEDERGFFARSYCEREMTAHGLEARIAQCNVSFNRIAGTLRGMHVQIAPHEEVKLVRCTMGAIYDVMVDLRPGSASFKRWYAVELTAQNRRMLFIPKGVAHGFQTLEDNTEVFYQMSEFYHPESARGMRFDDPSFEIQWPLEPCNVSDRDRSYAPFDAWSV